jgi:phage terminase large subunit-like protein
MKRLLIVIGVILIVAAFAFARAPKSDYQWTGTVLEADGDHLVVEKGKDKWEFAYDKDTKVTGTLKVGAKVTVKYLMKATSIEAKEEAKKAEPKKK